MCSNMAANIVTRRTDIKPVLVPLTLPVSMRSYMYLVNEIEKSFADASE
jgi:hypothetical protein